MGVLYNVPRIGLSSNYKQKGPTCWYYVSKMLLKFHEKLDKQDATFYSAFKLLHQLRSALTDMSTETRKERGEKAKVMGTLKDQLDPASDKIQELETKLAAVPVGWYRDHLLRLKKYWEDKRPDQTEKARIEGTLKILASLEDDWSDRMNLLSAFVPTAGFRKLTKEKVFADTKSVELLLTKYGPFYVGGALSITVKTNDPVVTPEMQSFADLFEMPAPLEKTVNREGTMTPGPMLSSGDQVIQVIDITQGSGHAVCVAGIDGETIYYKDPNASDKVMALPIDKFAGAVSTVIALECKGCTHLASNLLVAQ